MQTPLLVVRCVRLVCAFAPVLLLSAQDAPPPPFNAKAPIWGSQWQLNGFGQVRFARPGDRHPELGLAQYSLTITPEGANGPAVFVQGGATTLGGNDAFLLESWAAHDFSRGWHVQAGRFLLPFSRQFVTSPANLMFADISAADAVFDAPYAWGALGGQTTSRIQWSAGLISSATPLDHLGATSPVGRAGAVGRVEINALKPFGYQESDPTGPNSAQLSIGFAVHHNAAAMASSVQNTAAGDRLTTLTQDAGFRYRQFTGQAALYERTVGGAWGGYVQSGFYVVPRFIEVAARFSSASLGSMRDASAFHELCEKTIGVNLYLKQHYLKLQANYVWSHAQPFGASPLDSGQFRLQTQFLF